MFPKTSREVPDGSVVPTPTYPDVPKTLVAFMVVTFRVDAARVVKDACVA
jgi:hypothetical protein